MNTDDFLIGHKGEQYFEGPMWWSPYIPFMQTPAALERKNNMKYNNQYWDRKIENVMNQFDFTQTYRVMAALDWTWADCDGVPDVEDQRETARRLLTQVVNERFSKPTGQLGTGGFMSQIDTMTGFLGLYFIAAEWEECDK